MTAGSPTLLHDFKEMNTIEEHFKASKQIQENKVPVISFVLYQTES